MKSKICSACQCFVDPDTECCGSLIEVSDNRDLTTALGRENVRHQAVVFRNTYIRDMRKDIKKHGLSHMIKRHNRIELTLMLQALNGDLGLINASCAFTHFFGDMLAIAAE